ncbi:unnamed protein product [Effrenium voratum]|nr:unnamed protein product [Effrenium voratum]
MFDFDALDVLDSPKWETRLGRSFAVMPDGVGIRYEVLGSGPCVVLIPGGQSGVCECQQFPLLRRLLPATGFRVLLHDRRNCGGSDLGGDGCEAEEQVEDLRRLLVWLKLSPAVIVGNSSGGRLGLLLARRYPELARALVLMNLTAGEVAARVLSDQYYKMYIPLLLRAPEANAAVLQQTVHYGGLCKQNSDNLSRLEQLNAGAFAAYLQCWATLLRTWRRFVSTCSWRLACTA